VYRLSDFTKLTRRPEQIVWRPQPTSPPSAPSAGTDLWYANAHNRSAFANAVKDMEPRRDSQFLPESVSAEGKHALRVF